MNSETSFHKLFLEADQTIGYALTFTPPQENPTAYESLFILENDEEGKSATRNHYSPSDIEKLRTMIQKIALPSIQENNQPKIYSDGLQMKSVREEIELPATSDVHQPYVEWEDEVMELMKPSHTKSKESSTALGVKSGTIVPTSTKQHLPENIVPFHCFDPDYINIEERIDPLTELIPNQQTMELDEEIFGNEIGANKKPTSQTQDTNTNTTSTQLTKKTILRNTLFQRFSRGGNDDFDDLQSPTSDTNTGTGTGTPATGTTGDTLATNNMVNHTMDERLQRIEKEKMKKLQKIERIKSINTWVDATQSLIKGPMSHHAKRLRETSSFLNRIRLLVTHLQHSRITMTHKNTKPDLYEMEYKYFHRPHMLLKERQRNWKISLKHASNSPLISSNTMELHNKNDGKGVNTGVLLAALPFNTELHTKSTTSTTTQVNNNTNTSNNNYYLLLEYIEESPPVMLNYGMVSTILNYYRTGTTTTTTEDEISTNTTSTTNPTPELVKQSGVIGGNVSKYPRIDHPTTTTTPNTPTTPSNNTTNTIATLSNSQYTSYLSYLPKHLYSFYELSQYYFNSSNHTTFITPLQHQLTLPGHDIHTLPPVGQSKILTNEDTSPYLFNIAEQETVSSFENTLFRCPIFRHTVPSSDFLLIKMKTVPASKSNNAIGIQNEYGYHFYHLKEIQYTYLAGQIEPQKIVPIPTSTITNGFTMNNIQEKFMRLSLLRILSQHTHTGGVTVDEIYKYLLKYHLYKDHNKPSSTSTNTTTTSNTTYAYYLQQKSLSYKQQIYDMLRQYGHPDSNIHDNTSYSSKTTHWRLDSTHEHVIDQLLRSFLPEEISLIESSLAYEYKLQHIHHIYFTNYTNNTNNNNNNSIALYQGSMELLLKIQYYLYLLYLKKQYYLMIYTNVLQYCKTHHLLTTSTTARPTFKHISKLFPPSTTTTLPTITTVEANKTPYYYQHPLLYYYHMKILTCNTNLEICRYLFHHLLLAPWNTTSTFVHSHAEKDTTRYSHIHHHTTSAAGGNKVGTTSTSSSSSGSQGADGMGYMQVKDARGDPSGISEGYAYIRIPYHNFTALQHKLFPLHQLSSGGGFGGNGNNGNDGLTSAQKKEENKIVGTERDLRKLHKNDAINILMALGVKKDEATRLKRWDRVHVIREMSNDLEKKGLPLPPELRKYVRDPILMQRVLAEEKQLAQGQNGSMLNGGGHKGLTGEWEKEVNRMVGGGSSGSGGGGGGMVIQTEEEYQRVCQEIWLRQRTALTASVMNMAMAKTSSSSSSAAVVAVKGNEDDSVETDFITGDDEGPSATAAGAGVNAQDDMIVAPGKDGKLLTTEDNADDSDDNEDEDDEDSEDDFEEINRQLTAKKANHMMIGSTVTSSSSNPFAMSKHSSSSSSSNPHLQHRDDDSFMKEDELELKSFMNNTAADTKGGAAGNSMAMKKKLVTFGSAGKANASTLLDDAMGVNTANTSSVVSSATANATATTPMEGIISTTNNTTNTSQELVQQTASVLTEGLTNPSNTQLSNTTPSTLHNIIQPWNRPMKAIRKLTIITQPDGSEVTKVEYSFASEEIDRVASLQTRQRKDRRDMRLMLPTSTTRIALQAGRGSSASGGRGGGRGRGRGRGSGSSQAVSFEHHDEVSDDYESDDSHGASSGGMNLKINKLKQKQQKHHIALTSATSSKANNDGILSIKRPAGQGNNGNDDEEEYVQKSYKSTKRSGGALNIMVNLRLPRVSLAIRLERELMAIWNHKTADVFRHSVNPTQFPTYQTIIAQPICLADIRERIATYQYITKQTFLADLDLMVANSRRFNGQAHAITINGEKLVESCKVNLLHEQQHLGKEYDTLGKLEEAIQQKEVVYDRTRHQFGRSNGHPLPMLSGAGAGNDANNNSAVWKNETPMNPTFGMFSSGSKL